MSKKRTIESFFGPDPNKKQRTVPDTDNDEHPSYSSHQTYPFPIRNLSRSQTNELSSLPASTGRQINDQPDLDLVYFEPYIPSYLAKDLFRFLRSELPFYRVEYTIKRGDLETQVRTPRFTTVFGLDETSQFDESNDGRTIIDAKLNTTLPVDDNGPYNRYPPRPIPQCLDELRRSTEAATGCRFNFCLVNYYASGSDSISFHSDDERFLGPEPAIASFSLGAVRDFLMKHKPTAVSPALPCKQIKLPLGSGDMILMRGKTQSTWLHSIPKRKGKNEHDGGRINITFRRAMVKEGTNNYYHYNVGKGPVFRWDETVREMREWKQLESSAS